MCCRSEMWEYKPKRLVFCERRLNIRSYLQRRGASDYGRTGAHQRSSSFLPVTQNNSIHNCVSFPSDKTQTGRCSLMTSRPSVFAFFVLVWSPDDTTELKKFIAGS